MESFDQFATDYQQILDDSLTLSGEKGSYFAEYKVSFIKRALPDGFNGKFLDYGCGVGILSVLIKQHFTGSRVDGFDISASSISMVPEVLKKTGTFTDQESMLTPGYDVIVIANVLHHTEPVERADVIKRIKRLLAPGGRLIIFEHNPANPITVKVVKESPLDKGVILLPHQETRGYLKDAGYSDVKVDHIVFFPKPLSILRRFEPSLNWLPFGAQYAVQGVKHA